MRIILLLENGAIFKLHDGSYLIGELVSYNESPYRLKILTGDTVTISPLITKKIYLPNEISIYQKGKYTYKEGLVISLSDGLSSDHNNFDVKAGYLFRNRFEAGAGFGIHSNSFWLQTISSNHFADVVSTAYYVHGKYFIYQSAKKVYATGKFGFANNHRNRQLTSVNNGITMEGGVGVLFASRKRSKYFLELSQYTSHAKGFLISNDVNALSDIEFDVWFHRIVFTFGIQFGK